MTNEVRYLLDWVGPGGFWTLNNNFWVWLDGKLLGEYFGWGENLFIPVNLEAGEHELLVLARDPWFLGCATYARFGRGADCGALSRRKYGEGFFLELAENIPVAKSPGSSDYFRQIINLSGVTFPDIKTTWSEGYELPTAFGSLFVFAEGPGAGPEKVKVGGFEMDIQTGGLLHCQGNRLFSVECTTFLKYNGKDLLRSEGGSALVIAERGKDFSSAKKLYLKLREGKGKITLATSLKNCQAFVIGPGNRKVASKEVQVSSGKVQINFGADELPYWTLIEGNL